MSKRKGAIYDEDPIFGCCLTEAEPKKQENNMNSYYTTMPCAAATGVMNLDVRVDQPKVDSEVDKQRRYLTNRAHTVSWLARRELRYKYGIDYRQAEDAEEYIQAIKDGKYKILDEDDENRWEFPFGIKINPVPKDFPGFRAADELLDKDNTALADTIAISSPADALAALQAFETKYATKH